MNAKNTKNINKLNHPSISHSSKKWNNNVKTHPKLAKGTQQIILSEVFPIGKSCVTFCTNQQSAPGNRLPGNELGKNDHEFHLP